MSKLSEKDILFHDSKTHCSIERAIEMAKRGEITAEGLQNAIIATFKELLPKPKQIVWELRFGDFYGELSGVCTFVVFESDRGRWSARSSSMVDGMSCVRDQVYGTPQEAKDACQEAFDKFALSLLEDA